MSENLEAVSESDDERRSSVRVSSFLPCAVRKITESEIPALEAHILDMAVVESEGVQQDAIDWSERADDIPKEFIFVLNELRSLRQQLTEIQRQVDPRGPKDMQPRWLGLNDRGMWIPRAEGDPEWSIGDYVEAHVQIPSITSPDVLAVGRVIRIDREPQREGVAITFRSISDLHAKAIMRYALRRERQVARSNMYRLRNR